MSIVVGYGTQRRKNLTSAQASVKAADIQNIPNSNLASLITGRASGVQITQNNGAPGAAATVRIRGISSLRAGNDPLYVVDEVPIMGNLNDINPMI
jgi:outer membrane cobalamin receptor